MEFYVRRPLSELTQWRRSHGATDRDPLFAYPDGREPIPGRARYRAEDEERPDRSTDPRTAMQPLV
jgi:hypothetical protein